MQHVYKLYFQRDQLVGYSADFNETNCEGVQAVQVGKRF